MSDHSRDPSSDSRRPFDDSICERCGASEQLTHHPLCQARDGTPTALSDDEVREAVAAESRRPGIDDHFGLCPHCLGDPVMLNVERNHFAICREHKMYWFVGSNLFSAWQYEDEAVWQENSALLETYTKVEPGWLPETVAAQEAQKRDTQRVESLWFFLNTKQKALVMDLLLELTDMEITEHGVRSRRDEFPPPNGFPTLSVRMGSANEGGNVQ
jgi:hypothetical protein